MTVVAWDGKTLATDTKVSGSKTSRTRKLFEHEGWRLAIVGDLATAYAILEWFIAGRQDSDWQWRENTETQLIGIDTNNNIHCWLKEPTPFILTSSKETWGSGADYAMAALALGLSAVEAVQLAIDLDDGCGGEVESL